MENESQAPMEMGTKPIKEHEWLQQLVGEWQFETEMTIDPDGPKVSSTGTSSVTSLGGLWAFATNHETMPNSKEGTSYFALGYDVTFKKYRACWIGSMSSHLWNYTGTLSQDGKTMTLDCEGPSMTEEPGTAYYREVIELVDADHRTTTSYGQDEKGEWQEFAKAHYSRV